MFKTLLAIMFVFIMLNFNLFAENIAEKYSRECEQGDFASCNKLGAMYYTGSEGIKQNFTKAVELLQKPATKIL